MKKLTQLITSVKLNQKITLFVIVILAIPVIIFSIVIFEFLRDDQIRGKLEDTKISMAKSQNTIRKNVEMCNMSTQVFLNARPLMQFVIDMKKGTNMETERILDFFKSEVTNLEKIANSNPYLYQIRMYVDAKKVIEFMPILYNYDRLRNLEWAKNEDFESGTWQFDYEDAIFPEYVKVAIPHIVSIVTRVNDFEYGELGVIEVATKMELLFPDMYSSDKDNWCAFIDNKGKVYFDPQLSGTWEAEVDGLLAKIKKTGSESYYELTELKGNHVIVACEYVKVIDGYLLKIVSVEADVSHINRLRNIFVFILVAGFGMVTLLIIHSIRALLRRLYEVINAVNLIGEGNLSTRVPVSGDDEVGHLAQQINLMLEYMTKLMKQGIQKERLIKDTEIRALQNQINAHFIYNVLESIKMMAEIKEQYDVSDALTSLGKLLRYTMKWGNQFVTVGEEIEYIKNYLALINLRFDYI